ncbi:MAG: peptide ABC transporter permease [Gammaproteobacteria bacterium]|nr:MAG: peptide ABC transporter permease [Gammaproteobacteria bacterium]
MFAITLGCLSANEKPEDKGLQKELIVLAAPISGDPYYADQAKNIFEFHVEYVNQIHDRDDVLVFVDEFAYDDYVDALGEDKVVIAPMSDIWMRDFSFSNAAQPIMFRYTAAGQGGGQKGQGDADAVQERIAVVSENAELVFKETDLLNDGGNYVDDYAGNVVISRKFLRDNDFSEEQARSKLRKLLAVKNVAFIESDEQGGLEHADGVVAFVDANVLVINSYAEDPDYANDLRADLERGLPGVTIHEIVTPYDDSEIYDDRFGSACGLYTNALVTANRIYLPQFGIPEDEIALQQVRAATSREVVPVSSHHVCSMGGGVRCMSWQLRGDNAKALLERFK